MDTDYEGVIIGESLEDTSILDELEIISTEIEPVTDEHKTPWIKRWTLYTVKIPNRKASTVAEKLSHLLDSQHAWYADFKNNIYHYIVFKNKVFHIERHSKEQYEEAKQYGISLGIPEYQVDFHPEVIEWKR